MIVADTCLVTHLFNDTVLTETAQKILKKDPHWIVPKLWKEEYANVLSKLARKGYQTKDQIIKHFNYTVNELKNCEVDVDIRKALKISIEYKISVYDAHFIVLAIDFDALLITEDKEVIKNCPRIAMSMQNFI